MSVTAADQRRTVVACFLGWTLDAFDFFVLLFVLTDIAKEFGRSVPFMTMALTLTLAFRVVGALIFGRLADRFGRKPVLLINILLFSALSCASGFAPNVFAFLLIRSLHGIAMGGEWGVGTALAMETVPTRWRGPVSGLLQAGYPAGYLLAAAAYGSTFHALGWRGLFIVTLVPAVLIFYIRKSVPESPAWSDQARSNPPISLTEIMVRHWRSIGLATLLMAAAATFSHGTQDLYPTFLKVQHGLGVHQVALVAIIYNVGAIIGSLVGGSLSQLIGRRKSMLAAGLLAMTIIPFWGTASTLPMLAVTSFGIQFLVQWVFGVLPAHLNELAPAQIRSTFSGVVYQSGNLLTAGNATLQALAAEHAFAGDYGRSLSLTASAGALLLCVLAVLGRDAASKSLGRGQP